MKAKTKGMMSFGEIREMVCNALCAKEGAGYSCWIADIFPDSVVYESTGPDGVCKCYQRSYSISADREVTLGDATEVEKQVEYVPLKAACTVVAAAAGDATGFKWRVRAVEFGVDRNGNYWDKAALTASLARFEGAKVFALSEAQHQAKPHPFGKSVRDLVGILQNAAVESDGIYADLIILPAAQWLRDNLVGCAEMGLNDALGLSVDISGKAGTKKLGDKNHPYLATIVSVTVDVVYDPAAGGQFLKMAAAVGRNDEGDTDMLLQQLLAALEEKRPDLYLKLKPKVDDKTITEAEVLDQLSAAMNSPVATAAANMSATVAGLVAAELAKQGGAANTEVQLLACKLILRDELGTSKLPEPVQAKLTRRFEAAVFKVEDLRAVIKEEKETLDALTASGVVLGAGDVRITVDSREKAGQYLDDFFEGKVNSFRAAYTDITGDTRLSGDLRDAKRLTASLSSTSFAEILGDSLTRRMLVEYRRTGLSDWRKFVNVVPLNDFRTQHRTRMGGYGDLPIVGEGSPYTALPSPGDDEATYAAAKRGGTEDLTLEMLRNDDAGAIRLIPVKLGRAGARTLYKFVFSFLDGNGAIYDGTALFHLDHANLKTAALAKAALQAGRLQMMKQTELGGNDVLGIPPKFIIVPADLEDTAYELTVAASSGTFTPTAADSVRRQTWEIIANPFWQDLNNWYLAADPLDIPGIEIGFLDGREEPELFVQDQPTSGSMFSNDKLTYKLRHIYGGTVTDYRGFQGNLVP